MPGQSSNVDQWLKRETPRVRKALESASRHFDGNDRLTVNTLEAVYGQESSFGTMLATRAGKNPQVWGDVESFLEAAGADARETREYVRRVPLYEGDCMAGPTKHVQYVYAYTGQGQWVEGTLVNILPSRRLRAS